MDVSSYKSKFVNVNGIRLHYLDWGGNGPVLLFIPGMGCTAYIFDQFAQHFTDQFHVLALTRRGHGDSDCPETGYDADTLTEDLRQFLNALQVDQVMLAGHSLGYIELSHFANLYPERVIKAVFLEAAYDYKAPEIGPVFEKNPLPKLTPSWPEEGPATIEGYIALDRRLNPALDAIWGPVMEMETKHRLKKDSDGKIKEKVSATTINALNKTIATYQPNYAGIKSPVLSVFAIQNGSDYLSPYFMNEEQQKEVLDFFRTVSEPFQRNYIKQFIQKVPNAQILEIQNGHHYCFIKHEEIVLKEMRKFLLDRQKK